MLYGSIKTFKFITPVLEMQDNLFLLEMLAQTTPSNLPKTTNGPGVFYTMNNFIIFIL